VKICNLVAVLPAGLTIPPLLLFTKSLHEMIFTVVWVKICNLVAVLPAGLTIPPLLLFTKSLHEMIFTVVGGEDLQFVGCLVSRVNNPPTSSLYKEFAWNDFYSGWGRRFAICWLSCQLFQIPWDINVGRPLFHLPPSPHIHTFYNCTQAEDWKIRFIFVLSPLTFWNG